MAWIGKAARTLDGPRLGIAAILAAVLLLSFSDALAKAAGERFGLAQLVLLRSAVAAVLLAGWLLATRGRRGLRLVRPGWVWARSLCLAGMWLCYYAGLPAMSFALAAACHYTAPAWMALMTRALGEPVGPRGWAAAGLTLAGAALAIGPVGAVTPAILWPLAAAVFYALAGVVSWRRCREETAGAMALTLNLCLVLVAAAALGGIAILGPGEGFVLALWPRLGPADWALAGALGAMLAVIATAVALAYRLAPPPVVGVFDTAYLGFAALWGAVLFAQTPGPREAAGLGLIALGAGLAARPSGTKRRGARGGAAPGSSGPRGRPGVRDAR
ncbi:DMT family transporter [Albimonas pacifica]|uniref:Threonine/homoserine efflux transporter RhtA n=1 Tax=Albimonas pacifica TaxID=1114924 RepID=A0A1I3IUP2_9RHOB|nr:DMT family transporter [Albimonas pacifica]SFI51646.1 Threonine/homoserine efflux transporter RhtA [Albimonas pacifica]